MLISDAIIKLKEIQSQHGDLVIGMENVEFSGTFFPVSRIEVRPLSQTGDYFTDEDDELGDLFVGVS